MKDWLGHESIQVGDVDDVVEVVGERLHQVLHEQITVMRQSIDILLLNPEANFVDQERAFDRVVSVDERVQLGILNLLQDLVEQLE